MERRIELLEKKVDTTEKQTKQIAELQVKLAQQLHNLRDELKIVKMMIEEEETKKKEESEEKKKEKKEKKEEKQDNKKVKKEKKKDKKEWNDYDLNCQTLPRSATAPAIPRPASARESEEARDTRLANLSQLIMKAENKRDSQNLGHAQTPRNGPQFSKSRETTPEILPPPPLNIGSPPPPPKLANQTTHQVVSAPPPLPPRNN